uniref:DUF4939 domain-containing protein n=1 Tax=Gopherus agassizii TaxID=38772 RepID=A0A452IHS4_9SAUR
MAFEEWRLPLEGAQFQVQVLMDHKNLESLQMARHHNQLTQAPPELQIPIPDKFDSDHRKFHKFLNQCPLLFLMDLQFLPTDRTRVGLIINLLAGEALAWASQLLEKSSPLLKYLQKNLEKGLTLLIRIWEGDEWKSAFHT